MMMVTQTFISHGNKPRLIHVVAGQCSKRSSERPQVLRPLFGTGTKSPPPYSIHNGIHKVSPDSSGGDLGKSS